MGARRWTDTEDYELLFLFPLDKGVPPFGTKLNKYCKKWNRTPKAVVQRWKRLLAKAVTKSEPTKPETNGTDKINLANLVSNLTDVRDYLQGAVEELNNLIG